MAAPNNPTDKQATLPGVPEPPPENETDRAIRALRDFQGGKATMAYVGDLLRRLPPQSLLWASIATRIPVSTLEKLRGS